MPNRRTSKLDAERRAAARRRTWRFNCHHGERLEARLAMAAGPLVVSEIMYNPAGPSAAESLAGFSTADFDYLELYNAGDQPLDLEDYEFTSGLNFTFGDVTLGAGQYLVIVSDVAAFQFRNGASAQIAGEFGGSLGNGDDQLELENALGVTVFDFGYEDWYPSTDGGGYSLVLVNLNSPYSTWSNSAAWAASANLGGSPGAAEGPVDPSPPSTPQNLTGELDGSQINLAWDASDDPESGISEYRIIRDGQQIDTTTGTTYGDLTALSNGTYTYTVIAVNGANQASDPSNSAVVVYPGVGATPTFAPAQPRGTVNAPGAEASGIAASRANPGVFWIHNDGSQNQIFAINAAGAVLGTITLSGVSGIDTEDIAVGPGPTPGVSYIYFGDIGDNNSNRASVRIFRIAEPTINANGGGGQSQTVSAGNIATITLQYPAGAVDAEALFVDPVTGDLFVLSKEGGSSRVFRAPAASLVGGSTVVLAHVGTIAFANPSAADISPNGLEILVRNENNARLYQRAPGQSVADALASPPIVVPVVGTPTEPNGEAIAFDAQGNHYYTISEGNNPTLYFFHRTSQPPGIPQIKGEHIFYNKSFFDGTTIAIPDGPNDNDAIATDKVAYHAGQGQATFANYTSYTRGINGIMVDIANRPGVTPDASHFTFMMGNNNDPSTWVPAPAPVSVTLEVGGVDGSDRIKLIWNDGDILKTWLQVTVGTTVSGLAAPHVFYFGNVVGEGNSTAGVNAVVGIADEIAARNNPKGLGNFATVTDLYDYDRNRQVNVADQITARNHATTISTHVKLINIPGSSSGHSPEGGGSSGDSGISGDGGALQPAALTAAGGGTGAPDSTSQILVLPSSTNASSTLAATVARKLSAASVLASQIERRLPYVPAEVAEALAERSGLGRIARKLGALDVLFERWR